MPLRRARQLRFIYVEQRAGLLPRRRRSRQYNADADLPERRDRFPLLRNAEPAKQCDPGIHQGLDQHTACYGHQHLTASDRQHR